MAFPWLIRGEGLSLCLDTHEPIKWPTLRFYYVVTYIKFGGRKNLESTKQAKPSNAAKEKGLPVRVDLVTCRLELGLCLGFLRL